MSKKRVNIKEDKKEPATDCDQSNEVVTNCDNLENGEIALSFS